MKPKSDGVRRYVKATVDLYFEADHVCCQYCQLMTTYSRNMCMRTGELITDTRGTGMWCPLSFEDDENAQRFYEEEDLNNG